MSVNCYRNTTTNRTVEWKNRHPFVTIRSLLFGISLPTYLWKEDVCTANYISNKTSTNALHHITPYQRYLNIKPNVSHLRLFGSTTYLHVQKCTKLNPKSKPMILVGYDEVSKAYRCLNYIHKKIVISRDVVFDKTKIGISNYLDLPSSEDDIFPTFIQPQIYPVPKEISIPSSHAITPHMSPTVLPSNPNDPPLSPSYIIPTSLDQSPHIDIPPFPP